MDQPWLLVLAVAAVAAAAVWARSARYRRRQLRRTEATATDPDAIALVRSDLPNAIQWTDSYRPAIFALIVFFVIGFVLLLRVDPARGIREAGNEPPRVV